MKKTRLRITATVTAMLMLLMSVPLSASKEEVLGNLVIDDFLTLQDKDFYNLSQTLPELNISQISHIPIFFADVEATNEEDVNATIATVQSVLENQSSVGVLSQNTYITDQGVNTLNDMGISQAEASIVSTIASNPNYSTTLQRAQQLLEQGIQVGYIIFLANSPIQSFSRNYGTPFAIHGGFQFNVSDSIIGIPSHLQNWFRHTNFEMRWDQLFDASVSLVLDVTTAGAFSTVVSTVGHMRNFAGAVHVPSQLRLSEHNFGIDFMVTGDLLMRTILIEDRHNFDRVNNFVLIGHLERVEFQIHTKQTAPRFVGGGLVGAQVIMASSVFSRSTASHWMGNSILFNELIRLYTHFGGRQQYVSTYDLRSIPRSLVLR